MPAISRQRRRAILTAVLPLISIDHSLPQGEDKERLSNGFFITDGKAVSGLSSFTDEHFRSELPEATWSHITATDLYLGVSANFPKDSDPWVTFQKCNDKLDRFLLSLNLIGKLWSFRPDVRFGWIKNDISKREFFTVRHA